MTSLRRGTVTRGKKQYRKQEQCFGQVYFSLRLFHEHVVLQIVAGPTANNWAVLFIASVPSSEGKAAVDETSSKLSLG